LLALVVVAVLVWLGWALASRWRSLPCPSWLGWMVEMENPLARNARSAVIVQKLGLQPGMKVLDAGCGPGRVTVPVAKAVGAGGSVVALDLQAGMLERAEEKVRQEGLTNVRFVQAGLGEGQLPSEEFDRALLVTVLGEIPNREAALREIREALKPGGVLSVTETVFDPHYLRREALAREAEAAGFVGKAVYGGKMAYTAHFEKVG